jgi:hypothetical protein
MKLLSISALDRSILAGPVILPPPRAVGQLVEVAGGMALEDSGDLAFRNEIRGDPPGVRIACVWARVRVSRATCALRGYA